MVVILSVLKFLLLFVALLFLLFVLLFAIFPSPEDQFTKLLILP